MAHGALVGAVEQGAVGPFKIKHKAQGLTGFVLRKGGAATVHKQPLGLCRDLVGNFGLDHIAAAYRREVIAIGPVLGLVLDVNVELAGLERLEGDIAVAVELHFNPVEVVFAAVDRQVGAPPVLDALKDQLAPGGNPGNAIGAATQRWLEGGGFEVALYPVMLGQHGQFAQAQNQQRVA